MPTALNPEHEREYMGRFFPLIGIQPSRSAQRTTFPTLCSCMECHGIRDIYPVPAELADQPREDRIRLAYEVALVQHGYYLRIWEAEPILNRYIFPRPCACTHTHEWREIDQPGRCLHTYTCAVEGCGITRTVDSSD